MFHRSSFKQASFKPVSWRFDGEVTPPGPVFLPGGIARSSPAKKRRKRRVEDDALVLTLLLHELS